MFSLVPFGKVFPNKGMLGQMSRVPISDELVHLAAGLVWTLALSFNGLLAWAARYDSVLVAHLG